MILIDGYEIDAAVSEQHMRDADITEHPVESGAAISDHVIDKAFVLSLDVVVSDTPIGTMLVKRREAGLIPEQGNETPLKERARVPSSDTRQFLETLHGEKRPVTIVTSVRVYTGMVLKSISETINGTTGAAMRCSVVFQQVVQVTNERTAVRVAVPRVKKKVKKGNVPTKPAPEVTPAPVTEGGLKSNLKKAADRIRGR